MSEGNICYKKKEGKGLLEEWGSMANCNFKQGIGLVKEVTEQRYEEVRELS